MIFDYWSCGSARPWVDKDGKKIGGAFPQGFLKRVKTAFYDVYPFRSDEVAHICSGGIPDSEGITIDIDPEHNPNLIANVEHFTAEFLKRWPKVKWSIADPPYSKRRALEYYDLKVLVSKGKMLREMEKITEIGGFIGILDQYSLNGYPKTLKKIALIAVASIPNPDLRVFTVWRKIA